MARSHGYLSSKLVQTLLKGIVEGTIESSQKSAQVITEYSALTHDIIKEAPSVYVQNG